MITGDAALTATEVAKQVGMVGSGQKKPKKGEKPVVLYEMKENRADFSYESGGGDDIGEDVPLASSSEFAFVPLDDDHSETKDTIAYVPSNLRTIENMVLKNEIAVSVTGDLSPRSLSMPFEVKMQSRPNQDRRRRTLIPKRSFSTRPHKAFYRSLFRS